MAQDPELEPNLHHLFSDAEILGMDCIKPLDEYWGLEFRVRVLGVRACPMGRCKWES